jgi:hypothetical protein
MSVIKAQLVCGVGIFTAGGVFVYQKNKLKIIE